MKKTLLESFNNHDNDYSEEEKKISATFGNLIGDEKCEIAQEKNPNISMSIILPVYKWNRLWMVIESIIQQQYRNFEIIIVDDCPSDSSYNHIKNIWNTDIDIKYVRHSNNHGRPYTRNTWIALADWEAIISLDQDMIIDPQFTKKMGTLQEHFANAIITWFKDNIEISDFQTQKKDKYPNIHNDWRYQQEYMDHFEIIALQQKAEIEKRKHYLLDESDNYKKFSFGKQIWARDLASMVISHSLSYKRKNALKAGGFNEHIFRGWWMEDLLFGVNMIAQWSYVIPARSVTSYHINHERHGWSREIERKEFKDNLKRYIKHCSTPSSENMAPIQRRFIKDGKEKNITWYLSS